MEDAEASPIIESAPEVAAGSCLHQSDEAGRRAERLSQSVNEHGGPSPRAGLERLAIPVASLGRWKPNQAFSGEPQESYPAAHLLELPPRSQPTEPLAGPLRDISPARRRLQGDPITNSNEVVLREVPTADYHVGWSRICHAKLPGNYHSMSNAVCDHRLCGVACCAESIESDSVCSAKSQQSWRSAATRSSGLGDAKEMWVMLSPGSPTGGGQHLEY